MAKIVPIRDLKDTSRISDLCHSSNEPVYITKNGYGDMVIMSLKTFESLGNSNAGCYVEEPLAAYNIQKPLLYTFNELRKVLSPIFNKHDVKSATLFGSYARGEAKESSDVDILVDSDLKGLKFFGLVNDICDSLRVKADVYDVRELVEGSEIKENIKRDGVLIYGEKGPDFISENDRVY